MDVSAWLLIAGTLLGFALPGYLLLRGLRVPPIVALGAAPTILAGVLTPLTIRLPRGLSTGDGWAMTVWVVGGALAILGLLLWWRSPALAEDKREGSRLLMGIALGAMVVASIVTVYQVLGGMGSLDVPLQRRDSVSHYNAIAGITNEWGTVHPLETRGWMIGATGSVSFYPSLFHALAATIPVSQAVTAGNVVAIVCAVVWIVGLTSLARVLLPAFPGAWIAAPLFTLLTLSFPLIPLFRHGQWPFALSLALTPGLLALLIYSARTRSISGWLAVLVGVAGVVGAHPSGISVFAVFIAAWALVEIVERVVSRHTEREPRMPLLLAIAIALGAVAAYVIAARIPSVISMGSYSRPQTPALELSEAMVEFSHFNVNEPFPIAPAYGLVPLLILGSVILFMYRPSRVFAATGAIFFVFLLLTPMAGTVAAVTGAFWYGDPERILGALTLFTVIAAALGTGWLAEKLIRFVRAEEGAARAGVSLLIIALAMSINWMERSHVRSDVLVAGNYQPSFWSPYFVGGPAWTYRDADFWDEAAPIVGDDGVMTDSASGGVLLPAMENVRAVPAVTSFASMPAHGEEAGWGLRSPDPLDPDSAACVFMHENDIRWVYLERSKNTRFADSHYRSHLIEPHGVLELKHGPRELWRIDDCWGSR